MADQKAPKIGVGAVITERDVVTLSGEKLAIPDPGTLTHLQFRRFAGCPICNVHLHSFVQRQDEIRAAGVREVVVFHSPEEELRHYQAELPFAVVPDPEKILYREFGVEASPRALLDPRALPAIVLGNLRSVGALIKRRGSAPNLRPSGGLIGLPGDFLIAPDGRVLACKYGVHSFDQWSVDELLALVPQAQGRSSDATAV